MRLIKANCLFVLFLAALLVRSVIGASEDGLVEAYEMPAVVPFEYVGDLRDLPPVEEKPVLYRKRLKAPRAKMRRSELNESVKRSPLVSEEPRKISMPAPIMNFDGLMNGEGVIPPDPNGDVGPNDYVQAVNISYGFFDKTTGSLLAVVTEDQLFQNTGNNPCNGNSRGDPIVVYDTQEDRWILSHLAFAVDVNNNPIPPFYQCIAASKTGDPVAGGWNLYPIQTDTGGPGAPPAGSANDYSKFGIWPDCLYMSANEFDSSDNLIGVLFASFSKSDLYSGSALTYALGFLPNPPNDVFTLIPSNLRGTPPPTGTPNYYVSQPLSSNSSLAVRKFSAGTNCGAGGSMSAPTTVSTLSWVSPADENDVPQPNTSERLDSIDGVLMQKVQYRRIGANESLWVTESVGVGTNPTIIAPLWAQLNVSGGVIATTPVQQQIYQPDTTLYRWMGSIAADRQGNVALGYSTSNGSLPNFPSIAYSGRLASDPLNTLPQGETELIAGFGSQVCTTPNLCNRWGDYTAMTVDPVDDCTFWYTNEYYASQADANNLLWRTRIGSFKFPGCVAAATPTITTIATGTISLGAAISDSATLSGGNDPTGTIVFTAYGPVAGLSPPPTCTTVAFTSAPIPVSGDGPYGPVSFTPTSAGTYFWIASYSGDINNNAVATACGDANETSVVLPVQPSMTTNATASATVNSTISDTATLSGGRNPTGSITFQAFGPVPGLSPPPDCTALAFTSAAVPVSGNATYGPAGFTATLAGNYFWVASYSGDVNNLPIVTACGAPNEVSVVSGAGASLTTSATASANIGSPISDMATLANGDNPSGMITFTAYGPVAGVNPPPTCTVLAFTSAALSVSGNGSYGPVSFTPAAAGTYFWKASYSGDINNPPVSTACGDPGEKSLVSAAEPSLVTSATVAVDLGSPISDQVTIANGDNPGGTITFMAFGPVSGINPSPTCINPAFNSTPIAVAGNGTYGPASFTPAAAGTYFWIASYSGDGNNNAAITLCGDPNEKSIVNGVQPSLVTIATASVTLGATISDSATLSGGNNPTGNIVFKAYGPVAGVNPPATCTTLAFTSALVPVSGNATYGPEGFTPTAAGTYFWTASYSGDNNNNPVATACGDANEESLVQPVQPSIVTSATATAVAGSPISDTATLSGGSNPSGTIIFRAYGPVAGVNPPPTCTNLAFTSLPVPVSGNGSYGPVSFSSTAVGTYFWTASYSGDNNNNPIASACGDANEMTLVQPAQPNIVTHATVAAALGASISDTATLSLGSNPGGTIVFKAYGPVAGVNPPATCTTLAFTSLPVPVSGNGTYGPVSFTPGALGTYFWTASYSGDNNNNPVATACGDPNEQSLVSNMVQPSLSTQATESARIEQAISDTAFLSGGNNPSGTIVFTAYGPVDRDAPMPECTEVAFVSDSVVVNGNGTYGPVSFEPEVPGIYYWIASYSGDSQNLPVTTHCGDQGEMSIVREERQRRHHDVEFIPGPIGFLPLPPPPPPPPPVAVPAPAPALAPPPAAAQVSAPVSANPPAIEVVVKGPKSFGSGELSVSESPPKKRFFGCSVLGTTEQQRPGIFFFALLALCLWRARSLATKKKTISDYCR